MAASFRAHPEGSEVVTPWWAKIGGQVRHGFREAVTYGLPPNGEAAVVIRAVVMGERPKDAEALIAAFRNSGTLHVFCVSGLHVGLVGAFGWLIFRGLGLTRRTAILGLVIVMFGYAWLTGNGPPAVRAAWMATVFLGAFVLRRQPDLLNALGGVLLALLLWDGRLIFQPGVQLSYGVVAAIAVGCRVTYRIFEPLAREEPYVPRSELSPWQHRWHLLRLRTAQSLAVSSSAWVGSAPLTAFHFALITPISVFASVLMMPAVFCLLGAALVSALCFPFAPVVSLSLNRVNGLLASGTVHLARASATVPGGNIQLRREGDPFLLIYDLGFGANGACFSGGRDGAVLINAGDAFGFKQRMLPSLAWLGVRPDAAIFTHPEGSCMGGGEAVWNALPLRQVMLPVRESRSAAYHAWLDARKHRRWQTRFAQAGDTLPLPAGATWRVLRVAAADTRDALADDRVAIAMMDWGGWKFLWLNDAGLATERELLASGMDLRADVIVASKHQRDSQLSDDLIRRVQPRAVILSNEDHPDAMIRYWRSLGIKVIEQSATGGLTTKLSPHGELIIHGFVDHSRFLLDPSP